MEKREDNIGDMTPIILKTSLVFLCPAAVFWIFVVLKKDSDAWYVKPVYALGKLFAVLCLAALFCPAKVAAILGAPLALLFILIPITPRMSDLYAKIVSATFLVCAILILTGA